MLSFPTPTVASYPLLTTTIESVRDLEWVRGQTAVVLTDHGIGENPVADTGLVITELAVNGFEHGGARLLEVRVALGHRNIIIELLHVGLMDLAIPSSSSMPDPLSPRHRGLAIVDCLSQGRETLVTDRGSVVRCFIAR